MNTDPLIRGPIDPHAIFVIRWVAVAGQLAALLFTFSILKFELPLLPALAVIGSSAIVNLWHIHAAQRRRLYQQANFLEQQHMPHHQLPAEVSLIKCRLSTIWTALQLRQSHPNAGQV